MNRLTSNVTRYTEKLLLYCKKYRILKCCQEINIKCLVLTTIYASVMIVCSNRIVQRKIVLFWRTSMLNVILYTV